jgi:hypothetical protein
MIVYRLCQGLALNLADGGTARCVAHLACVGLRYATDRACSSPTTFTTIGLIPKYPQRLFQEFGIAQNVDPGHGRSAGSGLSADQSSPWSLT